MLDVVDIGLVIFVHALAISVVAGVLWRRCFRKYKYLVFYAASLIAFDILRYTVLRTYGLTSKEYFFAYFLTDGLLAVVQNLLILSFFDLLFQDSPLRAQVRLGILGFFALVGAMSYVFISNSQQERFYSRLMVEFAQNMYFASVVLAVLLCMSLVHLRVADPQLGLLMAGLGILVGIQASGFALQNLLSKEVNVALSEVTRRLPALATAVMMGLWNYALVKQPVFQTVPQAPVLVPALSHTGGRRS